MQLSYEDKILIKQLRLEKGWGRKRLLKEFPNKKWKLTAVGNCIRKIDKTGSIDRTKGSGRPRSQRESKNIQIVEELILSQEEEHSHFSPRVIERNTGISRSHVRRIVKEDLSLKVYKRLKVQKLNEKNVEQRIKRTKRLLSRFPNKSDIRKIWFSDEKKFTVVPPVNTQNDRVYSNQVNKRSVPTNHSLIEKSNFSPSVMISAFVSKRGKAPIFFCGEWS